MAGYNQFGYGSFPAATQLSSTDTTQQTRSAADGSSSLNSVNAPVLSPLGVDCQTNLQQAAVGGEESGGTLSPDGISQSSNVGPIVASLNNSGGGSSGGGTDLLDGCAGTNPTTAAGSCCENGRPIITDPVSGQTICSCQYDSARLAFSSYSRLPAASVGVYGTPYPSTDQNPYQSIGVDSSAFYSPLTNPYALKETTSGSEMGAWTSAGLQPSTGYYSYDPMSAYGYGASYDLAARRKNATRESTATLKAWLNEHKKNPYPTKGEKIMLAIITKMTLTQVSTWFANARRRLKKENKMTWEPKNRTDDDDGTMVSDDEKDKVDIEINQASQGVEVAKDGCDLREEEQKAANERTDLRASFSYTSGYRSGLGGAHPSGYHSYHHQHSAYYQNHPNMIGSSYHPGESSHSNKNENRDPKNQPNQDCGVPIPANKPKIWSLADTVACKTPPPAYISQEQLLPQHQHSMEHVQIQMQQETHINHDAMGVNTLQQPMTNPHTMHPQQHEQSIIGSLRGTPYPRAHTSTYGGFLGATMQQLHTTANTLYNSNANNSSSSSTNNIANNNYNSIDGHTTTIPITGLISTQQDQQQPVASRVHYQYAASQRAMGFPEAQPDTPPQTPPNMKLSIGTSALQATASQVPTTTTCLSNNFARNITSKPLSFKAQYYEHSSRDDCSSGSSSSSSATSPQLHSLEAPFKPMIKRDQITISGFLPSV